MRKTQLATNEYYHIYNRGVDKRKVFLDDLDYLRFLKSMKEFNCLEPIGSLYEKSFLEKKNGSFASHLEAKLPNQLVQIIAYCLNPNHYHFILRQIEEKGIEKFMQRIGTGYSKFFNQKYERTGSLFQGPFKSSQIQPNNLLYLSAYVNCNSEIHGIAKAGDYRWSSFLEYVGNDRNGLCMEGKKVVLDNFKGGDDYKNFAKENVMHFQEKKIDEKLILE
jgi:REP element-mobilizing transposase RayT